MATAEQPTMENDMPDAKAGKDARMARTTGTDSVHERRKANPGADNLTDPKEVWKEGETTPSADRGGIAAGGQGRVADAGDLGEGQPSPYCEATQADALARQTSRENEPRTAEKPKQ